MTHLTALDLPLRMIFITPIAPIALKGTKLTNVYKGYFVAIKV